MLSIADDWGRSAGADGLEILAGFAEET